MSTEGQKCDSCKPGSFGLNPLNPNGCTTCFCFGRSQKCSQAKLTWGQVKYKNYCRIITLGGVYYSRERVSKIFGPPLPIGDTW